LLTPEVPDQWIEQGGPAGHIQFHPGVNVAGDGLLWRTALVFPDRCRDIEGLFDERRQEGLHGQALALIFCQICINR
jgi:hypothetical protein